MTLRTIRYMALALALAGGCAPAVMPPSSPSRLFQQPLPGFRRPTLRGPAFDSEGQRGRVVVVKFFAKYCVPCQKTLPLAEQLQRERPDLVVVGISEDEDAAAAHEQVDRYRLGFPVIHDIGSVLAGRFRVTVMPMTFVSDGTGKIVWVGGPEQGEDELRRAVAAAAR